MNNIKSQDEIQILKLKRRLIFRLMVTFIFLVTYCFGVYSLIKYQYLQVDHGGFTTIMYGLMASQIAIYAVIFIMLTTGSKLYRILFWIAFIFSTSLIYIPGAQLLDDIGNALSYIILILCMLVKTYVLYKTGLYLHKNPSAKAFFNHVLEINTAFEPKEEIKNIQESENPKPKLLPNMEIPQTDENRNPPQLKAPVSYQKLAIRLGICVYVSLGVFPVFVQLGHSIFASIDYNSIFANRDMFIACLVSAMIWTLPIFYLYYNHPKSKQMVILCIIAEIGRLIIYMPFFIGYMKNQEIIYPLRTYTGFIILEVIRYAALYKSIKPIFKLNTSVQNTEDYDNF